MSTETIDYRRPIEKLPLRERINFRMLFFIGFVALLVGYPVYVMVDMQVTGGVKQLSGGYTYVDLKAMSTFTFDQVNGTLDDIPRKWRDLDGQKVILKGEMYDPRGAGQSVDQFVLVFSIATCCVTSTPQVQHFVYSKVVPGNSVNYYGGTVEVRGTLHVNVRKEEGRVSSVYNLDVESTRPAS